MTPAEPDVMNDTTDGDAISTEFFHDGSKKKTADNPKRNCASGVVSLPSQENLPNTQAPAWVASYFTSLASFAARSSSLLTRLDCAAFSAGRVEAVSALSKAPIPSG